MSIFSCFVSGISSSKLEGSVPLRRKPCRVALPVADSSQSVAILPIYRPISISQKKSRHDKEAA